MELQIFQVDAFSDRLFSGNPAAVVPLTTWLPDEVLQNIALENNLSETAFYIPGKQGYQIRWFTPTIEVNLCGHATLATAHVLFNHFNLNSKELNFESRSGLLTVQKEADHYTMIFPTDELKPVTTPVEILKAFKVDPLVTFKGKDDYLIIVDSQYKVERLQPDFKMLSLLEDCRGVIISAPGTEADFVSRCFYPQAGVDEDPATGSAHTTLTPYWSKALQKEKLTAVQLSKRVGLFECEYLGKKTAISGNAKTYLVGSIYL